MIPERIGLIEDGLVRFALACRYEWDVAHHYLRADGPTIHAVREALAEACATMEIRILVEFNWPHVRESKMHSFFCDMNMVAGWRKALKMLEGEE